MHKKLALSLFAAAFTVAVSSCSDKADAPLNPVTPITNYGDATLKATAPAPVSPSGITADSRTPTLVVTNSTMEYGQANPSYRFQVLDETGKVFEEGTSSGGSGGRTSYTVKSTLAIDKQYSWLARSEHLGAYGPWSVKASFRSPKLLEAYINGNELYDPLTTGAPSPLIHSHGHAEWFEGLGGHLMDRKTRVQWVLPTIVEGEVSFEAVGIRNSGEEWKTKILSMEDWCKGNTTDNPFRVTLDKRSEWVGQGSRVRFTMRSNGTDAGEPRGGAQAWDKTTVYGWRFTWRGGTADLWVYEGGFDGPVKEHLTVEYDAPYAPLNHCIRLGSPFGRADKETLPNVVIRHLWVSSNPRPADLGKQ